MEKFLRKEVLNSGEPVFVYSNATKDEMTKMVEELFRERGYIRIEDKLGLLEFEKGSRIKRIFLGAFHKYFKFSVKIDEIGNGEISVCLIKTSTGMSGGVIGMGQINTERDALSELLCVL